MGRFAWRRSRADASLLIAVVLGVLVASTVLSGAPMYVRSLERVGIGRTVQGLGEAGRNLNVANRFMPFTRTAFRAGTKGVLDAARSVSPLVDGTGDFVRSPQLFWGPAETGARVGPSSPGAFYERLAHVESHVDLVSGRLPSEIVNFEGETPVVEAMVPEDRARGLNVAAGDVLEVTPSRKGYGRALVVVTGIFRARDAREQFWGGLAGVFIAPDPPTQDAPPPLPLFLRGDAIFAITADSPVAVGQAWWFIYMDQDVLRGMLTSDVLNAIHEFRQDVEKAIPRAQVFTGPYSAFKALKQRAFFARIPTFLMGAMLVSLVAYYLFMVAGLLAERRRADIGMLRSRGVSTLQLARLYAIEAAPVVGAPALAGPFLAMVLISQMGRLPVFSAATGGAALTVELAPAHFAWAAAAGLSALAILLAPALMQARGNVVVEKQTAARPARPPLFQRYFLDVIVLALGGLVLWELRTRQTIVAGSLSGEQTVDISSLFAPVLFLIAVALVLLRGFPLLLGVASWVGKRRAPAWVALGIWKLARSPYQYAWPILLLVLASGLAVVAATLASTLELSSDQRIAYATAGDVRLVNVATAGNIGGETITSLRNLDGVRAAAIGVRASGTAGTTGEGSRFSVLAVEPDEFARVSWFRDDFAKRPLADLMAAIRVPERAPPITLPEDTAEIRMYARADPPVDNLFLWVVIRDASGRSYTLTLGAIDGPNWTRQSAEMPERAQQPAHVVSILTFEPVSGDAGTPTTVYLDDLEAVTGRGGGAASVLVTPFEDRAGWAVMPTSEGLDTVLSLAPEADVGGSGAVGTHRGAAVAKLQLGRGTDSGVRGVYRAIASDTLPVIASEGLLASAGLRVGEPFVARMAGQYMPLRVVDTATYFPTMDPGRNGFVVMDLGVLLDYAEFLGAPLPNAENEVFLALDGESGQAYERVLGEVRGLVGNRPIIDDRAGHRAKAVVDALAVAGWRGMAYIAIGSALAIVLLGYVAYLVAYAARAWRESAFLQVVGMSRRAYLQMLVVEHGSVALAGLAIGTVAGLYMSRIAVSSVAHTETGGELLPPFVLTTQWVPVSLVYAALALAGLGMGAYAARALSRLPISQLTRFEE